MRKRRKPSRAAEVPAHELEAEGAFLRGRQVAIFEAQGLVAQWDISRQELRGVEREVRKAQLIRSKAIREIKKLMRLHRLSPRDIEPPPVTHKHPVTGESWDGHGDQPPWLRKALLQEGLRPADLRAAIESTAEAT